MIGFITREFYHMKKRKIPKECRNEKIYIPPSRVESSNTGTSPSRSLRHLTSPSAHEEHILTQDVNCGWTHNLDPWIHL
jgi:hypothetical protein